ncbi:MAG: sugar transferase [Gemmataceae bacterium]
MYAETHTPVPDPLLEVEASLSWGSRPSTVALPRSKSLVVPVSWYTGCKRLFDLSVGLLIALLALPIILLAALLVKLTSRGPIFYCQTRVGRNGKPFTIWKLRSMYHNCEQMSGIVWSKKGDPRVTPVGRFLRRSHIDELPQLLNILRGEMSLVGPRPERPEFVPQLEAAIPRYRDRLLVLPGVTGLAQIHLGPDTDLASVERKLAMDLYYVKTISFWNDLKIVVATAIHVLIPYRPSKWFFRLTPEVCAQRVGTHIRESSGS